MKIVIPLDIVILLILVPVSLEINVPYALDQLDFHQCDSVYPNLSRYLVPGDGDHPLVVFNNNHTPLKLVIRSLSLLCLLIYTAFGFTRKDLHYLKLSLCIMIILMHVLIPQALMIYCRIAGDNPDLAHDGGTIQMEESMKMILSGKNPYGEDFTGTPLENWRGFSNNVIYHVPYMPGAFLFSLPFFVPVKGIWGVYDQRLFHMITLMIASAGILLAFKRKDLKRAMLMVLCLNPFMTKLYLLGSNDIIPTAMLILSLLFLQKRRWTPGFLFLAMACSIKQFSWFFVPFLFMAAFDIKPFCPGSWVEAVKNHFRSLLPGFLLFTIPVFLFLLWDFSSFWKDTFLYASGGLPTSYPMQGFHGYGFATFLLFFRVVPDGNAHFPFILLQIPAVAVYVIAHLARRQNGIDFGSAVLFSSVSLAVFMYFSRYFHGNFVGFTLFWIVYAICMLSDQMNRE